MSSTARPSVASRTPDRRSSALPTSTTGKSPITPRKSITPGVKPITPGVKPSVSGTSGTTPRKSVSPSPAPPRSGNTSRMSVTGGTSKSPLTNVGRKSAVLPTPIAAKPRASIKESSARPSVSSAANLPMKGGGRSTTKFLAPPIRRLESQTSLASSVSQQEAATSLPNLPNATPVFDFGVKNQPADETKSASSPIEQNQGNISVIPSVFHNSERGEKDEDIHGVLKLLQGKNSPPSALPVRHETAIQNTIAFTAFKKELPTPKKDISNNFAFTHRKSVSPSPKISTNNLIISQAKSSTPATPSDSHLESNNPLLESTTTILETVRVKQTDSGRPAPEVVYEEDPSNGVLKAISTPRAESINLSNSQPQILSPLKPIRINSPTPNNLLNAQPIISPSPIEDEEVRFKTISFSGKTIGFNPMLLTNSIISPNPTSTIPRNIFSSSEKHLPTSSPPQIPNPSFSQTLEFLGDSEEPNNLPTSQPPNLDSTLLLSFGRLSSPESMLKLATLFKKIIVYSSKIESIRADAFQTSEAGELEAFFDVYAQGKTTLGRLELSKLLEDMGLRQPTEEVDRLISYLNRIFSQYKNGNQGERGINKALFSRLLGPPGESGKIRTTEAAKWGTGEVQIAAADFHSMKQILIFMIRKVEDLRGLVRGLTEAKPEELFAGVCSETGGGEVTWLSLSRFLEAYRVLYMPEDLAFVFQEFSCAQRQMIDFERFCDFFKAPFWKL